jgi:hypothetical protein
MAALVQATVNNVSTYRAIDGATHDISKGSSTSCQCGGTEETGQETESENGVEVGSVDDWKLEHWDGVSSSSREKQI